MSTPKPRKNPRPNGRKRPSPAGRKKTAAKKPANAFNTENQASRVEEYHAYFSEMFANRNPAKRYPSHRELARIVGGVSVSTVKRLRRDEAEAQPAHRPIPGIRRRLGLHGGSGEIAHGTNDPGATRPHLHGHEIPRGLPRNPGDR